MSTKQAIGVFDSGVGGLTVLREMIRVLPYEELIYLGDTARLPYGSKSGDTVLRYSQNAAHFLVKQGIKALVIACNTASAYALEPLQKELSIPVIGVIEPGADEAIRVSENGQIGVIATSATVASGAYTRAIKKKQPDAVVVAQACPLFVPLAEEGWVHGEVPHLIARRYLEMFTQMRPVMDTLVLGCTHYPLLEEVIKEEILRAIKSPVHIVSSARATAMATSNVLASKNLLREKPQFHMPEDTTKHRFFVTDAGSRFAEIATLFLGKPVRLEWVDWGLV